MTLCGQALLDFSGDGVDLRVDGLVHAATLLVGHILSIVDGRVNLVEALLHVTLEAGREIRILEGVTDACGASL